MIAFRDFALRRGGRLLLSGVDAVLHDGWKIGVAGRNGSGKSSLFAAIRGEVEADAGALDVPGGLRIASVAQETPALPEPAIDYVLGGDTELAAGLADEARARVAGDHAAAAAAHHRIDAMGGYDGRARAGRLLHGLGFKPDEHERPVAAFSGGWRGRLNLARALMAPSDLLLLDEPTNHLDLDAVLWLEQWLRRYPRMLMVVSHDREFLDGTVDHVLHLEQGGARLYAGNYSDFERQRAERLHQQQAAFAKEQAERAHLQSFINRFRAKATKARQAQSRIKRLEKLAGTEAVRAERAFEFRFPEPERVPQSMLKLDHVDAGYRFFPLPSGEGARRAGEGTDEAQETTLAHTPNVRPARTLTPAPLPRGEGLEVLSHVRFSVEAGDRIGLLGPNGADGLSPLPSGEGARRAGEGTDEAQETTLAHTSNVHPARTLTPAPLPRGEGLEVLSDVRFSVEAGDRIGLLGPNGADGLSPLPSGEGARRAGEGTDEAQERTLAHTSNVHPARTLTPAPLPRGEGLEVLSDVRFSIEAGDRIGLLGPNGAGKSTLVKTLVGELTPLAGEREAHKDVVIGYFAQHTVESLRAGETAFDHLRELAPDAPVQILRDWLGQWHFPGDRAFEPVERFSGGERARLALALIAWRKPNLLVLDEPTNHLDLDMREALADALNDYPGALVLVAHDRHLLGLVCDGFWRVADGSIAPFNGDLDDYARWLRGRNGDTGRRESENVSRASPRERRREAAAERERQRAHRRQLQKIEARLVAIDAALVQLQERLADPAIYEGPTAVLAEIGREQSALRAEKAALETEWLAISEALEAATA